MTESHHQNIIYSSPYWLPSQLYFRTHWRHSISKITSGRVNLQNESMWETGPINHLTIMSGLAITSFFQSRNLDYMFRKEAGGNKRTVTGKRNMKPLTIMLNSFHHFIHRFNNQWGKNGKCLQE